jgi:hypothetical protein
MSRLAAALLLTALCLLGAYVLTPASATAGEAPQYNPPHVGGSAANLGAVPFVVETPTAEPPAPFVDTAIRVVPMILPPLGPPTVAEAREWARQTLGAREFRCLDHIVSYESKWNPLAVNKRSGAMGLGQALPGSKMAPFGADWRTNPLVQLKWMLQYLHDRYGSACRAWAVELDQGWY